MMRTQSILLPALVATILPCAPATAQNTKVLPLSATSQEGDSICYHPFFYDADHAQVIWDAAVVASGAAVLSGINFRRDGSNSHLPALNLGQHTARIGHTSVAPAAMSKTFASNITAAMTTLVNGSYNIPALPAPNPAPAPFAIKYPLTTPFLYVPSQGNFLLDWTTGTGSATVKGLTDIDGVTTTSSGGTGAVRGYGSWGTFANKDAPSWNADALKLVPGGSGDISLGGFSKNYAANLIVGLSDTTYNGLALPFDLGLIGAKGNQLLASLDVTLPFALAQTIPGNWTAKLSYPLPNNNQLVGLKAFVQSYYADAGANNLGLVVSSAMELKIGSAGPIGNMIAIEDTTSPSGNPQSFIPVVQFTGSIQ